MREIKFRAWDGEKYIYSDQTNASYFGDCVLDYCTKQWIQTGGYGDNCFILEQFTGLHDKNGKEIYEGDVLKVIYPAKGEEKEFLTNHVVLCHPEGMGFFIQHLRSPIRASINIAMKNSVIIGNIHENPELLEVK